jgi:hypothetical protein
VHATQSALRSYKTAAKKKSHRYFPTLRTPSTPGKARFRYSLVDDILALLSSFPSLQILASPSSNLAHQTPPTYSSCHTISVLSVFCPRFCLLLDSYLSRVLTPLFSSLTQLALTLGQERRFSLSLSLLPSEVDSLVSQLLFPGIDNKNFVSHALLLALSSSFSLLCHPTSLCSRSPSHARSVDSTHVRCTLETIPSNCLVVSHRPLSTSSRPG